MRKRILLVEKRARIRRVLARMIDQLGWEAVQVDNTEAAFDALGPSTIRDIALVFASDRLGGYGQNGADLFLQRSTHLFNEGIAFVLMTDPQPGIEDFELAARAHGMYVIRWPFRPSDLQALLVEIEAGTLPQLATFAPRATGGNEL